MSISAETHTHSPSRTVSTITTSTTSPRNLPRRSACLRRQLAARSQTPSRDEDLVARSQSGDAVAYAQLYERYHPYVGKIVSDDVCDVEARHDISQSVFERGWVKIGDLRSPKAFRPWLAQLARRQIIDHFRSSSRTISTDFSNPSKDFDLASADWSAYDWAAMHELAADIRSALDALPDRDAAVLTLASNRGFSSNEIATTLNIEAGHARVLLHRARRRLGQHLGLDLEPNAA